MNKQDEFLNSQYMLFQSESSFLGLINKDLMKILSLANQTYYMFIAYHSIINKIKIRIVNEDDKAIDKKIQEIYENREELKSQDGYEFSPEDEGLIDARLRESIIGADQHLMLEQDVIAKGILLSAYSQLENVMFQLSNIYQDALSLEKSVYDFKGLGIERSANYLKQIRGLENLKGDKCWFALTQWNLIRNQMAHSDGVFEEKIKQAFDFLGLQKKYVGSSYIGNRRYEKVYKISITFDQCITFLRLSDLFLSKCLLIDKNQYCTQ